MTAAATPIRQAFDAARVARIAIVDDGYDPPAKIDVDEGDWATFAEIFDEDPGRFAGHVPERDGSALTFGDVRDTHIAALWTAYFPYKVAVATAAHRIEGAADTLFAKFFATKQIKLGELRWVEEFAKRATESEPDKLPSSVEASELAKYDLVFLDFFLGEEMENGVESAGLLDIARQRAKRVIQETMKHALPNRTPLFVLISSRATNETVPVFRDEAELLASKFRFLTKPEFKDDLSKTEYVLTSLVSQREPADAVEKLLHDWQGAIGAATTDMMNSVRRLDIADYAYLRQYRLSEEKTSLLEYLTWLFNAYLGSFVETKLVGAGAQTLKPLTAATDVFAVLPPMSELPSIYSAITTTKVRSYDDGEPAKVWTGDLFVRRHLLAVAPANDVEPAADAPDRTSDVPPAAPTTPEPAQEQNTITGTGPDTAVIPVADEATATDDKAATAEKAKPILPDIMAVITPVCDLVPGRISAKSVVLIGGTMLRPGKAAKPSNHLIVLERSDRAKGSTARDFQINWDEKWPQSQPIEAFDGDGIVTTDFIRVGRLRDLYAAELAGNLSGDLGRVGVPIAPPFSHALSARVLYKQGKGMAELLKFGLEDPHAWEFYSKRTGEARHAGISEELIWRVRERTALLNLQDGDQLLAILNDPEAWRPLTRPFVLKAEKPAIPNTAKQAFFNVKRVAEHEAIAPKPTADVLVTLELAGPLPDQTKSIR